MVDKDDKMYHHNLVGLISAKYRSDVVYFFSNSFAEEVMDCLCLRGGLSGWPFVPAIFQESDFYFNSVNKTQILVSIWTQKYVSNIGWSTQATYFGHRLLCLYPHMHM
jgi:hypothetical protein